MDGTKQRHKSILVLGMHRSGTSLVAEMVDRWGAYGGEPHNMLSASEDNPAGYWEYIPLVNFNNELLAALNATWYVPPEDDDLVRNKAKDPFFRDKALALIDAMSQGGSVWYWKDPRIALLLPFWAELLSDFTIIVPLRNPLDIVHSIKKRENRSNGTDPDRFPASAVLLLWQYTMMNIFAFLENTKDCLLLEYEPLVQDPLTACSMLCDFLDKHHKQDNRHNVRLMAEAAKPALRRNQNRLTLEDVSFAAPVQIKLQHFIKAKIKNPELPFLPAEYPLYAGWRDCLEMVEALTLQRCEAQEDKVNLYAQLYCDTGCGFNERQSLTQPINGTERHLEFHPIANDKIKGIRFDPINEEAVVSIHDIRFLTDTGETATIQDYATNALWRDNKSCLFAHDDPSIHIELPPHAGRVTKVSIDLEFIAIGSDAQKLIVQKKDEQIQALRQDVQDKGNLLKQKDSELEQQSFLLNTKNVRIVQLQSVLDQKERYIQHLLNSASWKVTAPLRRIRKAIIWSATKIKQFLLLAGGLKARISKSPVPILRLTAHRMELVPVHDISKAGRGYMSTGRAPQFLLKSSKGRLPYGWVSISFASSSSEARLCPRILAYTGPGSVYPLTIQLPPVSSHHSRHVIHIPSKVQSLYVEPMEAAGAFTLHDLTIREIGFMELFWHVARHICSALFASSMRAGKLLEKCFTVVRNNDVPSLQHFLCFNSFELQEHLHHCGHNTYTTATGTDNAECMAVTVDNAELTWNSIQIAGWAIASSGMERIEVYLDGRSIGNASLGIVRSDVAAAHPDIENSRHAGFHFFSLMEISHDNSDRHHLLIRAVAKSGACREAGIAMSVNEHAVPMLTQVCSQALSAPQPLPADAAAPIDIVLSAHHNLQMLQDQIAHIAATTSLAFRLFIIQNGRSDNAISTCLAILSETHKNILTITMVDSERKNALLRKHLKNHCVLLDPPVALPVHWLERLMHPILNGYKTASAAPLCTAALGSLLPHMATENNFFNQCDQAVLDHYVRTICPDNNYLEVTGMIGSGRCIAFSREIIGQIGLPSGMLDRPGVLCQESGWYTRALQQGFRHLLVPNLFLAMAEDAGTDRGQAVPAHHIAAAEKKGCQDRIISVNDLKARHGLSNQLRFVHLMITAHSDARKPVLIIDHQLGGGANAYRNSVLKKTAAAGRPIFLLTYDYFHSYYELAYYCGDFSAVYRLSTHNELLLLAGLVPPGQIILNNAVSFPDPLGLLATISRIKGESGCRLHFACHDYLSICPDFYLINERNRFCGIPDISACTTCLPANTLEELNLVKHRDIKRWREAWEAFLHDTDEIVCFSNSSQELLTKAYPLLPLERFVIIPHQVDYVKPVIITKTDHNVLNIGVLGSINHVKGSKVIRDIVDIIEARHLDFLKIVIIGEIDIPITSPQVTVTGRYTRDQIEHLVQRHKIDIFFIPSICSETFSFTTEEVIRMDLPVAVFNLGAPAERVKTYEKGFILNNIDAACAVDFFVSYYKTLRSRSELRISHTTKALLQQGICVQQNIPAHAPQQSTTGMVVFTSICANYIPKAIVLAQSCKQVNPSLTFVLCLLERSVPEQAAACPYFDQVVLAKDLGFDNFDHFIFRHSIVEASTAIKGQAFKYLAQTFGGANSFLYLDPDIIVLSDMSELYAALDAHAIVLTPHLTIPEQKLTAGHTIDAVMDNELCALQHGVYNLGFLAIRRSPEALAFIDWWTSRLAMFCYNDIPRGIFTDQRWMDLAPCFFNVHLLRHPGYNVAPWNLSMRQVMVHNGTYSVNGFPLRFFHFSGFDSGDNQVMINKYVPDRSNPIWGLRDRYVQLLNEHGQETFGRMPWSYDYYASGEKIAVEARIAFRSRHQHEAYDPFVASNSRFLS